ncbi:dTDP-4-dehydrorhamnose reductase [Dyella kyungheensis]|uniref:dTDP-4-dehydrorhamnose reductase n=1 Tax=Dyella kyungheensis TaxID=1242174 RepID=UPI003CEABFEE
MNILLLGANGQLGRSFVEQGPLAELGSLTCASRDGRRFDGANIEVANFAQPDSLRALLDRIEPQIIINTAAYTAVDRAESEEALAHCINGEAVGHLGEWARRHRALVVHYSSDYVFDGNAARPYTVRAPTNPLGAYGRSKLAGELALQASGAQHFTFRTAWVYGAKGQNFLRTMLRLGTERDLLKVVADQRGTPTPTRVIVDGTIVALQHWLAAAPEARAQMEGTYHLVTRGETTWHGFASAIFELAQTQGVLNRRPFVEAITAAEYPSPARRPAYSILDTRCFEERFAVTLPVWQDGLIAVMHELAFKDSETPC